MLTSPSNDENPVIRFSNVVKHFGGAQALKGASLSVRRGSVHGLVGQNGAGKSTLIKLLAGLHDADEGEIAVDGQVQPRLTPHLVEKLGIHFIHQDRLLVPILTVSESLFLGQEPRIAGTPFLDHRAMKRRADEILMRYFGVKLPAHALISDLSTAEKQIIQITRALLNAPKVIVFDEPTAALVRREADILFRLIHRLRDEGITVIYISHYLNEIEELCDTVTVLRNGRDVATLPLRETSAAEIANLMVARDISDLYPKRKITIGKPVLKLDTLSLAGKFDNVSLTLGEGEILGLTGLLGSGAKDLIRTLFGLETATNGTVEVKGEVIWSASPAKAAGKRLALVPEDRRKNGVALDLSVSENTTLASLARFTRSGFLDRKAEHKAAEGLIKRLQIKTESGDALVRTLSGGNQQKVAIAKWLSRHSEIYLLDEPTVGVDIAAKVEIYDLIGELASRGAGILILSSDLPELIGITDRVLVMFRGRIISQFISSQTSPDEILAEATGSSETLRHVG